jgi:xylan 1,4-beta-xylosidase
MSRFFRFPMLFALAAAGLAAPADSISIDAKAQGRPFPHFWERCFGSGRAVLSLRESYRHDLDAVKKATDFQYIRFHAIFHDENGVYAESPQGEPVYNFNQVDLIYDGVLERGVKPYVELSFMPRALASEPTLHPFWYKPIVAPPKDYGRWAALVETFARHLIDRYGINEVASWYFEVWNEPNLDFWAGNPKLETYCRLYDAAARAIKKASPRLRVGGPATAQAALVADFIEHCVKQNVPVDFVSTHVYGNDSPQDVFGAEGPVNRRTMVARAVDKVFNQIRQSPLPALPIHWSEFNASYMNEVDVTDSPYMGPWLAQTIAASDGKTELMSYWTFSDVFEEQGIFKTPFYGGYGLIANHSIPKAAFNVFGELHRLGSERLPADSDSALVSRRKDGSLVIAVWNYAEPGQSGPAKAIDIVLRNTASRQAILHRVDAGHGSSVEAWVRLGKPSSPTRDQELLLRKAAAPADPEKVAIVDGRLSVTLPAHGLAVIEIPVQ